MPKLTDNQHRNMAFWGMAMIVMGLPLSVFLVSVGTFVLVGNWLLEANYLKRLKQFFSDPLSLILVSIFLLFCIGMIWTENISHGLKELRVKLPLILMPLLLFTSKLPSKKRQQDLLLLFVVACMVGTVFGTARYFEVWGGELQNSRHISVFISHIRFGLMLAFSFFILAYFLFSKWKDWSIVERLVTVLSMIWILWFLIILEAFTAYFAFGAVLIFTLINLLLKQRNRLLKTTLSIGVLFLLIAGGFYLKSIKDNHFHEVPFDYKTLTVKTVNGNYYTHQRDIRYRENGHRVWNFVCWDELKKEWPTRSAIDFEANDHQGQPIRFTAIRYMTSKGLMKDSVGIHQLSEQDIQHIEQGFTNHLYTDKLGVARRTDQFFWAIEEYSWQQNANNSSALQRWVYLQVGWSILKENLLLGVGTGDVFDAYKQAYTVDDRGMEKQFQGISHNQFLSIGITLGIIGLAWFLFAMAYPLFVYKRDYLYVAFILLMAVSFLSDNTFDRQSGVTLFAFFNAFLIARREFAEVRD
ncbi:MAG: O-antigen ligase family protein [Flavobacteriales bacterium]|nr:O-antigen ligase family protein [Flavobacteriales bacterium]